MAGLTCLLPREVLTGGGWLPRSETRERASATGRGCAGAAALTPPPPQASSFTAASASEPPTTRPPLRDTLAAAGRRALGGGIPGAAAMGVQVLSLMWLRTTVNYQYSKGMGTRAALAALYKDGGVRRFYRGVGPALIQGPLSRFGDTAANAATLSILDAYPSTAGLPAAVKTMAASLAAGGFRICLMPVDAVKTSLQVNGADGVKLLRAKIGASGPGVLYHGALASAAATTAGHYPWFAGGNGDGRERERQTKRPSARSFRTPQALTLLFLPSSSRPLIPPVYNSANAALPQYDDLPRRLLRSAVIGFVASAVSDTVSNSIRVVKVSKQAAVEAKTYPAVVREIIAADGVSGLLTRGLTTKILSNGLQGLMFSVLWRLGQDAWDKREEEKQ